MKFAFFLLVMVATVAPAAIGRTHSNDQKKTLVDTIAGLVRPSADFVTEADKTLSKVEPFFLKLRKLNLEKFNHIKEASLVFNDDDDSLQEEERFKLASTILSGGDLKDEEKIIFWVSNTGKQQKGYNNKVTEMVFSTDFVLGTRETRREMMWRLECQLVFDYYDSFISTFLYFNLLVIFVIVICCFILAHISKSDDTETVDANNGEKDANNVNKVLDI